MNRRQLLQSMGLVSAHALFPAVLSDFLISCANKDVVKSPYEFFTREEVDVITEVVDIILPATNTLSASQTNTPFFLDQVFFRCMNAAQQQVIREGLSQLAAGLNATADKVEFITETDQRAYENVEEAAYFKIIKQYTLVGFFTSQEGTTKASNYVKIPDSYKGEVPVSEETLNYGKTNLYYYL